jgi:pyruvate carboxylase
MEGKQTKPKVITLVLEEGNFKTHSTRKHDMRQPYTPINDKVITAFIPGTIRDVFTSAGKKVKKGEILLILDAMKMENHLCAPYNGVVKKVNVKKDDKVTKNQVLVELK